MLSERAYAVIRDRILKGDIPLGAALSRRELAAELGMSLLPISEAIQSLENDGLVETQPRVGTRVIFPTPEEIRERYEVREALEAHAARLYAANADIRQQLDLERMADHLDAMFIRTGSSNENDRDFLFAVHSYHMQFHSRIAEYAGCAALARLIERNHVLVFNWLFDIGASRPRLPQRFHRDLIAELNAGDIERADSAMRAHIRHDLKSLVDALGARSAKGDSRRVGSPTRGVTTAPGSASTGPSAGRCR